MSSLYEEAQWIWANNQKGIIVDMSLVRFLSWLFVSTHTHTHMENLTQMSVMASCCRVTWCVLFTVQPTRWLASKCQQHTQTHTRLGLSETCVHTVHVYAINPTGSYALTCVFYMCVDPTSFCPMKTEWVFPVLSECGRVVALLWFIVSRI